MAPSADQGKEFVSAMEKATKGFKAHINTFTLWTPGFGATGFIQDSSQDNVVPMPVADEEVETELPDPGDIEGDEVSGDSDAEDEKMEDTMKTQLFDNFGPPLDQRIHTIRSIDPGSQIPGLKRKPYDHQTVAAARLAHIVRTRSCGAILGDHMGFGKTATSIMTTLLAEKRGDEGTVLIVTRKSLIPTWKDELQKMFRNDMGISVIVPTSETTPSELHKHDFAITNYENIVSQYTSIHQFIRPATTILSAIHKIKGERFRVIFDEAQALKNVNSTTNKACQLIPRSYALMVTATPFDNRWDDILGLLQLIEDHPFTSPETFHQFFGSRKGNKKIQPTIRKMKRLQKFLLGITIARPLETFKLVPLIERDIEFELDDDEKRRSDDFHDKYLKARSAHSHYGIQGPADSSALRLVVKAVQEATHPALRRQSTNDDRSQVWLESIRITKSALKSTRMREIEGLFRDIATKHPKERTIFTAEYTGVLDIVSVVLEGLGIKPVFYDGRVPAADRVLRLRQFQTSDPGSTVLLITPTTGGTGLNIPEASVMIQCNPWWNHNVEVQMHARLRRPGQKFSVTMYRLVAVNAKVESLILLKQRSKTSFNEDLVAGIRLPDDGPFLMPLVITPNTKMGEMFKGSWRE